MTMRTLIADSLFGWVMVDWDSDTFHPIVIFPEEPKVLDLSGSSDYGIDGVKWTIGKYDEFVRFTQLTCLMMEELYMLVWT